MNSETNQYDISIEKQKPTRHEEAEGEKEEEEQKEKEEKINIIYHINKLRKKNCTILLVDTEKTFDKM